ncbi:MurR/RpiR family transcriptional regulator [Citrobacter sp. JGM124]|uniref:MurR/RpiR family transcriptional regulator n=1 Tax=Citrobacter sp. JGM124 TaxID=2799789 RepID=UPI001BABCF28|nr:MurR/RpiR family transcriptional regulator [Citrobacter sp. JGM124]MBS0846957.1 MurR/RpiR family transcriptional regulator [Citrobacter sp. JGM124]
MSPQKILEKKKVQLSPELQRAADFICQYPSEAMTLSMRTFATQVGVKPATLLRLAQRLEYTGWEAFKQDFVQGLGLNPESHQSRAKKLLSHNSAASLYQAMFNAHNQNLTDTRQQNHQQMSAAIEALYQADHVYVCGFRASYPVAYTLFYSYRLFEKEVSLIDGQASNYEVFTRELTTNDVIVMIGFSPYSRESLDVLEASRQAGSKIVALTDSPLSPLARYASHTLYFSSQSPSFFPSVVAACGMAESLLALLVTRYGETAVKQIASAEQFFLSCGAWMKGTD